MGRVTVRCFLFLLIIVAAGQAFAVSPQDAGLTIEAELRYQTSEGVYLDQGSEHGLRVGRLGWLLWNGQRVSRVEVGAATVGSCFLKLLSERAAVFPQDGSRVELVLDKRSRLALPDPEEVEVENPSQIFVPLLSGVVEVDDARNVFHGQLSIRQQYQGSSNGLSDAARTRIRSSGSLDRIDGTPWSLQWSGDFSYRSGESYRDTDDFESWRPQFRRFAFSRRFDDHSTMKFGRFIPRALPSIGYIDGLGFEKVLSDRWRLGSIVGFKPRRVDLDVSGAEALLASYATLFVEEEGRLWTATGGILSSLFNGSLDRTAFLMDQRAQLGNLSLFTSMELDLDVGASEVRSGTQITRFDFEARYDMGGWVPRLRFDHFQLLDQQAERDLIDEVVLQDIEYFRDRNSRVTIGSTHQLGGKFQIDEQVSFTESTSSDDWNWRVRLTRRGLFGVPAARATFSVSSIANDELSGFDGRMSAYVPLLEQRLTLQPSIRFRIADYDLSEDPFVVSDVSVRAHYRPARSWSCFAGSTYSINDEEQRFYLDFGITYQW